jgi:hypothetical protein
VISLKECRKYLEDTNLSDKQVEELRDALYELGELAFDCYFEEKKKEHKRNENTK